jgi:hypothetical protein
VIEARDYISDIKKYTGHVNEAAVNGIIKHLGIALRNRDSSLVASTDAEEMQRVRESWLKRKLDIHGSDAELDKAVEAVVEKMKGERMKKRVTVYYLLAEHFKKLDTLAKTKAPSDRPRKAG